MSDPSSLPAAPRGTLTAAQIADLRRVLAAATPLPWHAPGLGEIHSDHEHGVYVGVDHEGDPDPVVADMSTDENAEFIAAACNAMPKLLAEVEAQAAEVTRLRTRIASLPTNEPPADGLIAALEFLGPDGIIDCAQFPILEGVCGCEYCTETRWVVSKWKLERERADRLQADKAALRTWLEQEIARANEDFDDEWAVPRLSTLKACLARLDARQET